MEQKKPKTILYVLLTTLGGGALLIGGNYLPLLWFFGLLLAPVSLAVFRSFPRARALLFGLGLGVMCLVGAPTVGIGLLLFVLWYGAAILSDQMTRSSPELFPALFYGGTLQGFAFCGAVCVCIKEHYGVWDIRGIFTAMERAVGQAIDLVEKTYATLLTEESMAQMSAQLDLLRQGIESFVYLCICMVLSAVLLHFFLTLKTGVRLCERVGIPYPVLPLRLLVVPPEITTAYLLVTFISIFFMNSDYFYALLIANVLMGYLFVLVGIGWVDSKMQKLPVALRNLIKLALLGAAFFRENLFYGIAYQLLQLPGIFISLSRRVIVRRTEGDDNE